MCDKTPYFFPSLSPDLTFSARNVAIKHYSQIKLYRHGYLCRFFFFLFLWVFNRKDESKTGVVFVVESGWRHRAKIRKHWNSDGKTKARSLGWLLFCCYVDWFQTLVFPLESRFIPILKGCHVCDQQQLVCRCRSAARPTNDSQWRQWKLNKPIFQRHC